MNKFFTSLLVATAVGLSAVGTQAMPLRSNQAGQFDQFSRWWMWRRLSSRTVRRMPRQWLLRRSLLGHPGCSCARSGSGLLEDHAAVEAGIVCATAWAAVGWSAISSRQTF